MKDKAKVDFPADRIFSTTVSGQPKSEVLQELEKKHPGTEYHFVEDKLGTLDKVVTSAGHTLVAAAVAITYATVVLHIHGLLLIVIYPFCQGTQLNCVNLFSKQCIAAVSVGQSTDCTCMHTNNCY